MKMQFKKGDLVFFYVPEKDTVVSRKIRAIAGDGYTYIVRFEGKDIHLLCSGGEDFNEYPEETGLGYVAFETYEVVAFLVRMEESL